MFWYLKDAEDQYLSEPAALILIAFGPEHFLDIGSKVL